MTSGVFHTVALDQIVVKRDERQRRELSDIETLADSIHRLGLIHPLVVTRDSLELVAGERRYVACRRLGWVNVSVQYVDELNPGQLLAIELEENIKRQDIDWKDRVDAVARYHKLRASEQENWDQAATSRAIGIGQQHISKMLAVKNEMDRGNQLVISSDNLTRAIGVALRAQERRDEATVNRLHESFGGVKLPERAPEEDIITMDFCDWVLGDIVPRFNLIHCDFPYGIEADSFPQGGAGAHGGYLDTRENWEKLMFALEIATKTITAPSCHLCFWFSMRKGDERLYEPTARWLERIGWDLNPMPLIWMKTDGAGIIPDPERGPRQIYETCFLASKGDRKIVRAVANAYGCGVVRDRHMSEKPEPMLRHFFRMLVDENTVMLDPTCGSGSALRAADSLGAKYVLGLEINPDFADVARKTLETARRLKNASDSLSRSNVASGLV